MPFLFEIGVCGLRFGGQGLVHTRCIIAKQQALAYSWLGNKSRPEPDMLVGIFSEAERKVSSAAENSLPAVVPFLFRAGFVGCGMTQFESSPSLPLLLEI